MAVTEKRVLTEFLNLYKDLPCLWDSTRLLYNNKESRERAYEVLLEKYRNLQEDATVEFIKKKIEYMRSAYRREHKKVLASKAQGGAEYKPTLWYYDLLTFLNDVMDFGKIDSSATYSYQIDSNDDIQAEFEEMPPKMKKSKVSVSSVFLPEQHHNDDVMSESSRNETHGVNVTYEDEPEAFGRTVGLQLRELTAVQRVIAEKLISDVIFNGRLNRLSVASNVCINYEPF